MSSIDKRIVDMQFNNKQFEQGIKESAKSLDALNKSLKLDQASKNISALEKQGQTFSLAAIGESLQAVSDRFSTFGIIGMTVLQNLTNTAVNAAGRILSSFTGMITEGGKTRAANIEQARFQFKGLGMDVEAALESARVATSGTAFGLDEAAKVASQLGASGVQAGDDMTKALLAISGVAAMTNSTYTDMGNIFTTVAGNGRLMGDQLRQLSARGINAAAVLGQQLGKTEAEVRDMVTKGEISFEIFYNAMNDAFGEHAKSAANTFSGAMSHVRSAFARMGEPFYTSIFNNLREALLSFRYAIDRVNEGIEPLRTEFESLTKVAGERIVLFFDSKNFEGFIAALPHMINSIKNLASGIWSALKPIGQAFKEIFPPSSVESVRSMAESFEAFTSKFKMGERNAENLRRTFRGLFAALDIGLMVIRSVGSAFLRLIGFVAPAGNSVLSFTGNIGDLIVKFRDFLKTSDVLSATLNKIVDIFGFVADGIKGFVRQISEAFSSFNDVDTSGVDGLTDNLQERFQPLSALATVIQKAFELIGTIISKLVPMFSKLAQIASSVFGSIADSIMNALNTGSFQPILDLINGGILASILIGVKKFMTSLTDTIDSGNSIISSFSGILDSVRGSLEAWQSSLKANTLLRIAAALGILTAAVFTLSMIDSAKLASSLTAMTVLFVELFAAMSVFEKVAGSSGFASMSKISVSMIAMSVAVLILAGAVKKLSGLDWGELSRGLVGLAGASAILVASAKGLSAGSGQLVKGAASLIVFAAAIRVLVYSVTALGDLDWNELAKGLIGVGVLVAELAIFLKTTDLSGGGIRKSVGLIALAGAINILATATEKFGRLNWKDLGKGLTAITVLLAELAIFTKLTSNSKHVLTTSISMTILAAAMNILGSSLKQLGDLSWESIAKGLLSMAGALGAITVAMNLLPKGMVSKSVGIIGVAAALQIITDATMKMGGMSWGEIGRGLVTLGGAMTILAVGLQAMKGTGGSAVSMLVLSGALAIFIPMLRMLGNMSWEEVARGLIALAGGLTVLGLAGRLLGPLSGTLIALAGALALFGIGIAAIGAGALALSAGLSGIAVSGAAAAGSLVIVISSLLSLIPMFFKVIGEGIVSIAEVLGDAAPILADAAAKLIVALVDSLVVAAPTIVDGIFTILESLLSSIAEYAPQIAEELFNILIGFLDTLSAKLPELIRTGANLLSQFLGGVFEVFGEISTGDIANGLIAITGLIAIFAVLAAAKALVKNALITTAALVGAMALLTALLFAMALIPVDKAMPIAASLSILILSMTASLAVLSLIPIPALLAGLAGFALIIAGLGAILVALGALSQIEGLTWLMQEGVQILTIVGDAIGSFIGSIVGGVMDEVSSGLVSVGENLSAFMEALQPFISGAQNIDEQAMNGVKSLAQTILILTAAGILEGLTSWLTGGTDMVAFGQQLAEFAPYLMEYADSVKGLDASVVQASANAAKALAEMASNLPNQGGVASWFAGENTLSMFAEELVTFGPYLKQYADSVKGLDAGVVENSANAAKSLSEMASNLPNQGGVASWFAGDNTMSMFGEELASFGPFLKQYADSVQGLDAGVVQNSANAAKALSELATNLPNSGGVISWFTGDNDIAAFGEKIVVFGESFSKYYNSISGINTSQLSGVIAELKKIVDLADGISDVDTSGLSGFAQNLETMGTNGITQFISTFTNANSKITQAAQKMMTTFIAGIKSKQNETKTTVTGIVNAMLTAIKNKYEEFKSTGTQLMVRLIAGIKSKNNDLKTSFDSGISSSLTSIRANYETFRSAGAYLVTGFVNGIGENQYRAAAQAAAMARAAVEAARRELDEKSPSKVFYEIGDFAGQGFVNALNDNISLSEYAGRAMASASVRGLKATISNINSMIDEDIDTRPVITPVLNLSEVTSGISGINTLFNSRQVASISNIDADRSNIQNGIDLNGELIRDGSKFTFIQNNTSPKALSKLDIYRQTKNQFALMKGLAGV